MNHNYLILWLLQYWYGFSNAFYRFRMSPEAKERYDKIKRQMEFYYSDANFPKDNFMLSERDNEDCTLPFGLSCLYLRFL